MTNSKRPNIFTYNDYRGYLADWYKFRKSQEKGFSYRSFAKEAGFASPNFLKLIVDGKRNLTRATLPKFIEVLRLGKKESEFFSQLIDFNQANGNDEKRHYFEKIASFTQYRAVRMLETDQFDYFSEWYHVVIRELVAMPGFREDPTWIARMLNFQITPTMAQKTIDLLLRLRLVERDAKKRLHRTNVTITSGAEVKSLALRKFHKEMLAKAQEALDMLAANERDITTLTIPIATSRLPLIKEKLDEIRKEILALAEEKHQPADRVYQLNLQLFPITKLGGKS